MPLLETGRYPYFIVPDIDRYRELDPLSEEARRLRLTIDVNVADPQALINIFGENEESDLANISAKEDGETQNAIDTFLDKFAADIKPAGYMAVAETSDTRDGTGLSSLVKSHKYEQAIKLIEAQNLNNPQKSIYFAHQMRFLKKLIQIEKQRTITKG